MNWKQANLHHSILLSSLLFAPISWASAIKMDVYIPQNMEVYVPSGRKVSEFNVHKIDGLRQKEAEISALLPSDPVLAQARLGLFVESGEYKKYAQDLMNGWNSINSAVNSGIKKIPAIIINDKFVAYGVDPKEALQAYDNYIIKHGAQWKES